MPMVTSGLDIGYTAFWIIWNYSGLEGLIVVKHGDAGDRSQRPSTPKVWLPSPLNTNALERN